MTPKLEAAEHAGGFTLRIRFVDGRTGVVDLGDQLWGEVFEPLRNPEVFRSFRVDLELNTIVWPSGADLAPEFLYEQLEGRPRDPAPAALPHD